MKKQCTKCQRILDRSEFYENKQNSDGLNSYCKECESKYQKKRHAFLKLEAINAFGGRCTHVENGIRCPKNSIDDIEEMDLIHPNGDGDEHRDLISNGQYGRRFYQELKNRGWNTDGFVVWVMCKSHHYRFDNSGKKNPKYKTGKFDDPIWLKERYVDDKMSLQEIADLCGAEYPDLIRRRMAKFQIERRKPGGRSGKLNPRYKKGKFNNPIWLKEKYDTMSMEMIAKECGVSISVIRRRMIKFGYPRRKGGSRP